MKTQMFATIVIILTSWIIVNPFKAKSQVITKLDTLYYLFDLKKIPINDRVITVDSEAVYRMYTINCRCSKFNQDPIFVAKRRKDTLISKQAFNKLKFISLPYLMTVTNTNNHNEFRHKFVVYFISPYKKNFLKIRAWLQVEDTGPTEDIDVRPDPNYKKPPGN